MYREPAPPEEATELSLEGPDAPSVTSLGCAVASGMAGAAVLGSPEIALVAGSAVLGGFCQTVRARWHRRRLEALRGFVGERVYATERAFTSLDGLWRIRFSADDLHPRFERLDAARGITLSSHTARERFVRWPRRETARANWYSLVHGRCLHQVCFAGRPPELGGRSRALDIRLLRFRVVERGVEVLRMTQRGGSAGDTWHDTMDDAVRQIEYELGSHAGPFRYGHGTLPKRGIPAAWI